MKCTQCKKEYPSLDFGIIDCCSPSKPAIRGGAERLSSRSRPKPHPSGCGLGLDRWEFAGQRPKGVACIIAENKPVCLGYPPLWGGLVKQINLVKLPMDIHEHIFIILQNSLKRGINYYPNIRLIAKYFNNYVLMYGRAILNTSTHYIEPIAYMLSINRYVGYKKLLSIYGLTPKNLKTLQVVKSYQGFRLYKKNLVIQLCLKTHKTFNLCKEYIVNKEKVLQIRRKIRREKRRNILQKELDKYGLKIKEKSILGYRFDHYVFFCNKFLANILTGWNVTQIAKRLAQINYLFKYLQIQTFIEIAELEYTSDNEIFYNAELAALNQIGGSYPNLKIS